jgi:hypothetical protein
MELIFQDIPIDSCLKALRLVVPVQASMFHDILTEPIEIVQGVVIDPREILSVEVEPESFSDSGKAVSGTATIRFRSA